MCGGREEDYPRTLLEFEARFATEEACREYLRQSRWPEGFVGPRGEGGTAWPATRGRLICGSCRQQTSVTAGTIFENTRKPLRLWFRTIWHVTSPKNGGRAMGLQRVLGWGSSLTAWTWLHQLRRAIVRPGRDRLRGRIEGDETYVGGKEAGVHGGETQTKALVVVAAQEDGRGRGRIRRARVPDASAASLQGFIQEVIEPGSVVHTEGWEGYRNLEQEGYRHEVTVLRNAGKEAAVRLMPRVHRLAALLQRWLLGTHQGPVSPKHLDYYLDQYTFRFNRRKSRSRGKLFHRLVPQAVQIDPSPYNRIVGGSDCPAANYNQWG